MVVRRNGRELVSIAEIAAEHGLAESTVRTMNGQSAQRRRANKSRPGDMPALVDRVGNSPLFDRREVRSAFDRRPGRGAGGGRPRKARDDDTAAE
ncbi:Uncharacterised protein [Mycobacteroides abscessus subsp. massiliense]|uniref:hypothetical protein n=1 Tax=Mycobacteroides abscessus TaxID=36809 RepID=UPI0009CDBFC1|nr:hypothetical protein [Mycobacteroides abscessus]SKT55850.1 Uncharacterised protein [Mycobacteroides abscessus subsp. massiliense]